MQNEEGTGIRYVGTDNGVATYRFDLIGVPIMYATVNEATDFVMWFRAPSKWHWVKTDMIASRSQTEPHRASQLSVANFILAQLPFLLAAVHNPEFARRWTEAVRKKNERFIADVVTDVEAFLAQQSNPNA